jgi:hypothetical protein
MVKVEVDDGLNVHGHVNLNDGRQGQGSGRRQPGDTPEAARNPLFDTSFAAKEEGGEGPHRSTGS